MRGQKREFLGQTCAQGFRVGFLSPFPLLTPDHQPIKNQPIILFFQLSSVNYFALVIDDLYMQRFIRYRENHESVIGKSQFADG